MAVERLAKQGRRKAVAQRVGTTAGTTASTAPCATTRTAASPTTCATASAAAGTTTRKSAFKSHVLPLVELESQFAGTPASCSARAYRRRGASPPLGTRSR